MSCDLLVLAPHPDDAELHCGGTCAGHAERGLRITLIDCTAGELASRGTPEQRTVEARAAAAELGIAERSNLGLPDGGLCGDRLGLIQAIATVLRRHRPRLLLGIAAPARHPDHLALAEALVPAAKAAALHRHASSAGGPAHAIGHLLAYEAECPLPDPTLLVPCSDRHWERKRAALACYASQFTVDASAPTTSISEPGFLGAIDARGRHWGAQIGAPFAEAFRCPDRPASLSDLTQLLD